MANTGYKIQPLLKKVSDDVNEYPLDVNNHRVSDTGLPQDTMANPTGSSSYKIIDYTSCATTTTTTTTTSTTTTTTTIPVFSGKWKVDPAFSYCEPIFTYTRTADFQKNTCSGSGETGTIETYSEVYSSSVSLSDAQASASADTTGFDSRGLAYANAAGSCNPPLPENTVGIIVVDLESVANADLCCFIDTPGAAEVYQQPVYRGNNFLPNNGTSAANCWLLASDPMAGTVNYRFQINIARLLHTYPSETQFVIKVRGRNITSISNHTGYYSLKGAEVGNMTMVGSPGSYIPATENSVNLDYRTYNSKFITGGANGQLGLAYGLDILTFTYTVSTKQLVLS